MHKLNLFYEEPDDDRWISFDRYPRRIVRRIIRGKPRVGGQRKVFINLCAGLELLGIPYRVNDYRYIERNPNEIACVVGKPHVLEKISRTTPILFGASVFSHPFADLELFKRSSVEKMLVPGEWMRRMCKPHYGDKVVSWPVGINTYEWAPSSDNSKDIDILLYDKVRWKRDQFEKELINPILTHVESHSLHVSTIRYGFYQEEEFHSLLNRSKVMIFLCEHETQGIAYQQALSCGVPILAWDRGGYWEDPSYFPEQVKFSPVSSVPYWDDRCGVKFKSIEEFPDKLSEFLNRLKLKSFAPREYVLENLTLEKCAQQYVDILKNIQHAKS